MKVIPRETKRVTYSTEIRALKTIPFTKAQRAMVIGNILGDGSLLANWSKTNYRLSINHCIEQKEYLLWKYRNLRNYILSKPRFYGRNNSLVIRTISHHELTRLRQVFYKGNKKIIPNNIGKFLEDVRVLAVWFMDDGNVRKRNGSLDSYDLNTQSFSLRENKRLARALECIHDLRFTINLNNGYYRLHLSARDTLKFRNLIEKFIIGPMRYKLG